MVHLLVVKSISEVVIVSGLCIYLHFLRRLDSRIRRDKVRSLLRRTTESLQMFAPPPVTCPTGIWSGWHSKYEPGRAAQLMKIGALTQSTASREDRFE